MGVEEIILKIQRGKDGPMMVGVLEGATRLTVVPLNLGGVSMGCGHVHSVWKKVRVACFSASLSHSGVEVENTSVGS